MGPEMSVRSVSPAGTTGVATQPGDGSAGTSAAATGVAVPAVESVVEDGAAASASDEGP